MSVEGSLSHLDAALAKGPELWPSFAWGVVLGGAFEYWRSHKRPSGERHVAKYAALGGLGLATFSALVYEAGKKTSAAEHAYFHIPAPEVPVVTRGAFAGMPRPLFRASGASGAEAVEAFYPSANEPFISG